MFDAKDRILRLERDVEKLKAWVYSGWVPAPLVTPYIAMWLWPEDYMTKAQIDTYIAYANGHVNLILAGVQAVPYAADCYLMGATTLCNQTATVINGMTPFQYLVQQAHLYGIKVHAWWVIFVPSYWMGTYPCLITPLTDNGTNHDTSNGGSCINYSTAAVRSTIIAAIHEFHDLNAPDGINLDYIRTDGVVTGQSDANVTSFVSEMRTSQPAPCALSVCALGLYSTNLFHQDIPTWLTSNYIDAVMFMGYYSSAGAKLKYWDGCDFTGKTMYVGIGSETEFTRASDHRATFRQFSDMGYLNFSLFVWGNSMQNAERQAPLNEYLAGNITATAPYPAVNSVTVTPATSFALMIGGLTYTTLLGNVVDHTTPGALKQHVELIEGERPWIHYNRPTTSTVSIQVGDWDV